MSSYPTELLLRAAPSLELAFGHQAMARMREMLPTIGEEEGVGALSLGSAVEIWSIAQNRRRDL